jgi:ATP-binding cassette subfamily B protein RaxB
VLELVPGPDFIPIQERQHVSLRALTGRVSGFPGAMVQVMGLALAIEILALIMPFQMQWVVDQVLISTDKSLLVVITLGFLIVIAAQTGLTMARAWVISWLGATLNAQWVTNLFGHLMKLPLDYFEKRHVGGILSRFSSVQSIQATLTGSFATAMLDGATGALALIVLFLYSAPLTGCVLIAFAFYAFLRWTMYRALWRINEEQLVYSARQQTDLMESVRGVQAIKLANRQSERKARVANSTLESAKRVMSVQRIVLIFSAINQGIFGAQRILLIAIGAYLAIQDKFSAGMLIAFVAYADQFSTRIGSLVDKIVEFRMLRLHAERIADIALAAPEPHAHGTYSGAELAPSIRVRDLSFRYAEGEPWILKNLDLTVRAGESVAIVGPSGCGKSTLAKLVLGLLTPCDGCIEFGGVDIRQVGLDNYRKVVGTVMQDDSLFAGTIADNISFFDGAATLGEIIDAARQANIHDEIQIMPMAYETLVGDMGSSLSGGQKQRLILARALYRKPRLLVLDEATSHLDSAGEHIINQHIRSLGTTRIVIAHRQETIASSDRIIILKPSIDVT